MAKVLRNQVLVKPEKSEEERTAGGIYVPQTADKRMHVGTVVKTGPGQYSLDGKHRMEMETAEGDVILYGSGFSEVELDGEKLHLMVEDNVFLVK